MNVLKKLKSAAEYVIGNWFSVLVILVCAGLCVYMISSMISKATAEVSPIEDVRLDVYKKGIEVSSSLSSQDTMIEFSRIYASGADIKSSVYFTMMDDFEQMCLTTPEELLFGAVSGIVGLNLDAASLYANTEFERADEYQKKSAELNTRLSTAASADELEAIAVAAGKFVSSRS